MNRFYKVNWVQWTFLFAIKRWKFPLNCDENCYHTVRTPKQCANQMTRMTKSFLFSHEIPAKRCEPKYRARLSQKSTTRKTTSTITKRTKGPVWGSAFSASTSASDCRKLIEIWCCDKGVRVANESENEQARNARNQMEDKVIPFPSWKLHSTKPSSE